MRQWIADVSVQLVSKSYSLDVRNIRVEAAAFPTALARAAVFAQDQLRPKITRRDVHYITVRLIPAGRVEKRPVERDTGEDELTWAQGGDLA